MLGNRAKFRQSSARSQNACQNRKSSLIHVPLEHYVSGQPTGGAAHRQWRPPEPSPLRLPISPTLNGRSPQGSVTALGRLPSGAQRRSGHDEEVRPADAGRPVRSLIGLPPYRRSSSLLHVSPCRLCALRGQVAAVLVGGAQLECSHQLAVALQLGLLQHARPALIGAVRRLRSIELAQRALEGIGGDTV